MNKTPLRLGLVCFCFAPLTAFALGVGQVTVRSALNQPLNADIELFSVKPSEFSNLKVVITPQSFTGSSAGPALFDYVLESRKDGRSFLKIRSKQSIREPLLNFRVAIEWPSGRLNRDFAVLLDPPGADGGVSRLAESVAPPIATPKRGKTAEGGQRATMAAPSSATGGEGGSSYGPVGHGETLWSIAARTRPDASISVQRMMQALMAANPHAFSRPARANRLYAGVTLRVPGADEISTHSIRKASIAQQRERVVKPASSPTVATASAQPRPAPKPDDKAVVRLLPPDSAGADNAPAADGAARVAVEGGALKLKTAQLTDLQARINALAGTDTQALLANPEAASAPPPADAASAPTTPSREEPANAAAKTIEPADRPRPAGTAPTHSGTNAAAPTTDATQPVTPKTEEVSAGGQAHSSAPRPAPAPSNTEPKPTEKVKDSTPTASAQTQTAEPSTAPAATSSSSTAPAPTQLASTTAESKPATATPTTTSAATASSQSKPPATPAKPDDSAAAVIATPAPTPPTPVADTTAKAAPPPSDFSRYVNIALDFAMGSILTVRNFFKDPALGDWTKDLTGELTEDPQKLAMLGGGGVLLLGLLLMMMRRRRAAAESDEAEFGADEPDFEATIAQLKAQTRPVKAKTAAPPPVPAPPPPAAAPEQAQARPVRMIANPMERIELLMAVGNHREAEELVRQALTEQADNPRLLAKLLDIHFAAKDAGKFVQDAEALRTKLDSDSNPLWQRALEMGRQIAPGHPLFGGGAGVAPTSRSKTTPGGSDNTIVRAQDTVVRRMPTAATPAFEQPQETVARPERSVSPLDFDLPSSANSDVTLPPLGRVEDKAKPADDLRALDLDFDLDELAATKGFDGGDATRPQFTPAPTSRPATNDDLPALPTAKQRQQTADSELQKLDFAFDEIKVQDASPLDLDEINTPPKSFESPIESKPAPKLALADEERDDLLASEDYVETKLDLATAYLDMDDTIGARSLLAEVMKEGNARQQLRARELLGRLPA